MASISAKGAKRIKLIPPNNVYNRLSNRCFWLTTSPQGRLIWALKDALLGVFLAGPRLQGKTGSLRTVAWLPWCHRCHLSLDNCISPSLCLLVANIIMSYGSIRFQYGKQYQNIFADWKTNTLAPTLNLPPPAIHIHKLWRSWVHSFPVATFLF